MSENCRLVGGLSGTEERERGREGGKKTCVHRFQREFVCVDG